MTNAPTVSQSLAGQVRAFRKRLNLTLNQLAERCEQFGAPQLNFSALANIERGAVAESKRRPREVNVDELLVLARALQVPPVLLLFQIGTGSEVELTPGFVVKPWEAAKWWNAEAYLQGDESTFWSIPVYLYRAHDRLIGQFAELLADRLFSSRDEAEKARRAEEADRTLVQLRTVRAEMRANGLMPPDLDQDLAFIDQTRHSQMMPAAAEAYLAQNPDATLRLVGDRPGAGKPLRPGDPTRVQEALDRGIRFAADFVPPPTPDDEDEDRS